MNRSRTTREPRHDVDESAAPERVAETPPLLHLQSQLGNAAVVRLLEQAQTKLEVGDAHDAAELEADRVAQAVVAALSGNTEVPEAGFAAECDSDLDDGTVMRAKLGPTGGELDAEAERALTAATSGGTPLPAPVRQEMEAVFRADFSAVRVHTDAGSAALADSMSARAFTLGGHIFLGQGQGLGDRELVAHELTHVVQQGASAPVQA